jgi:hypothetical protein
MQRLIGVVIVSIFSRCIAQGTQKVGRMSRSVGKTFTLWADAGRKNSGCRRVFSSVRQQGHNNEGKARPRAITRFQAR